jgi:O6-methylguanine-DNA--protein-cysteine methyltransferase
MIVRALPMKRKTQLKSSRGSDKKTRGNSLEDAPDNFLEDKRARVVRCIRSLPAGKVSSYGAVAKAAGWPGGARQVVRMLRLVSGLPW